MNDDERLKLEVAKLKYQFRTTLAATVIGPVILALLQWLFARQAAFDQKQAAAAVAKTTVAAANDVKKTAEAKAEEVKNDLAAATEKQHEKLSEIAATSKVAAVTGTANAQAWNGFLTKDPDDMNRAKEAVSKAAELPE